MKGLMMSEQKPHNFTFLLVALIGIIFMFVQSLDRGFETPDMGFGGSSIVEPIKIAALIRPEFGYMIVPYDEYTGRSGATPFETIYNDYDRCLLALFKKRVTLKKTPTQYGMNIKCDAPHI